MIKWTALVSYLALAVLVPGHCRLAAQSASSAAAPASATSGSLGVASGEKLLAQLETSLHTRTSREGEHAYFTTTEDLLAGTRVAVPRGSKVRATVTKVRRPGRLKGRAEIRLRFDEVRLPDGTSLPLVASIVRAGFNPASKTKGGEPSLKGEKGSGGNIAVVGQGGLQGAILGAVLGGGKGAAYGGAIGAGVGLASVILQRGPDLDLPRSTMFELKLDTTLEVP